MKIRQLALFILVLVILSPYSFADDEVREIKIGAIVSLSGPAEKKGRNWLEGAQLAEQDLINQGVPIKLIVEDDATLPKNVATAFSKLASVDKVDAIVGGTWDFLAEAAFPLAKQYKVPFITPSNPVEILSKSAKKNKMAMTNGMSLAAEKRVLKKFLKKEKIKSLASVVINVPYGIEHAVLLRKVAEKLEIPILVETTLEYESFDSSIKMAALRVSKEKPEAVFLITSYEGTDLFLRELEALKTKTMLITTQALNDAFEFSKNKKRYKNAYGIYPLLMDKNFNAHFVKKFGHPPRDFAGAGYDAVMFLAKAIKNEVPFGKKRAEFTYFGVTGMHSIPSKNSSIADASAQIMTTKDGEFEIYLK